MTEKYQWVEKYLGKSAVSQLMLTKDKTIVHGDILIDDKPMIKDRILRFGIGFSLKLQLFG